MYHIHPHCIQPVPAYLDTWRVKNFTGELIEVLQTGAVVILPYDRAHLGRPTAKREVPKQVEEVSEDGAGSYLDLVLLPPDGVHRETDCRESRAE